jgi:hypothetical protein
MDALAQLALMTKAKMVFESPGSFLSFPALSPISYSADQLKFGAFTAVETAERLIFSEFSRFANALPSGTIFQPQGDSYLWDAYSQVLKSARLAKGQTTPEQEAAYQQAVAFLSVTDANGWQTDSPALLTYKQYRDVWFGAVQDYKTRQSTAATATDAAAQTQWRDVDEPRLRAAVQQAEADWASKGGRAAVEQAQHVQQAYAAASPELTWKAWASGFNPDLDLMTDPNQMAYALTAFAPSDVFDQGWPTFTLTAPEIALLAAQAPPELMDIFGSGIAASKVESLSFEYRSVGLVRPWFRPAVFDARFWQLPEGSIPLSDGMTPPQGTWPAYATALVFVRKISLTMRDGGTGAPPQLMRALPALTAAQVSFRPQIVAQPQVATAARPQFMMADRAAMLAPAISIASRQLFRGNSPPAQVAAVAGRQAVPAGHAANPAMIRRRFGNGTFTALPQQPPVASTPPTAPPAPAPAAPPVAAPGNDISILAFICRSLAKTPNPDPALSW